MRTSGDNQTQHNSASDYKTVISTSLLPPVKRQCRALHHIQNQVETNFVILLAQSSASATATRETLSLCHLRIERTAYLWSVNKAWLLWAIVTISYDNSQKHFFF